MLLSNWVKNGPLRILNDLDSAGRGGRKDKEEGGTRRKEGRGGRRDEEEEETGRQGGRGRRNEESEKMKKLFKTRPSEANDASFSDFFIFHFLATL